MDLANAAELAAKVIGGAALALTVAIPTLRAAGNALVSLDADSEGTDDAVGGKLLAAADMCLKIAGLLSALPHFGKPRK